MTSSTSATTPRNSKPNAGGEKNGILTPLVQRMTKESKRLKRKVMTKSAKERKPKTRRRRKTVTSVDAAVMTEQEANRNPREIDQRTESLMIPMTFTRLLIDLTNQALLNNLTQLLQDSQHVHQRLPHQKHLQHLLQRNQKRES